MDGKVIINTSLQEAGNNGISTVYQEVNLCPNLTVAENILFGREPMKWEDRLEDDEYTGTEDP